MPQIHPTAFVDPAAELADDVAIGSFAVIEADTRLAARVRVEAHAQVLRGTSIGAGTRVGRGAILGEAPQDKSIDPDLPSGVIIGEDNVLREHVTIHRASQAGAHTVVGHGNYLMVGAHLAHDVVMGDHNMLANNVLVAGHVRIGSHNVFGGGAVFHQFIRIGDGCMTQGLSGFSKDLPSWLMGAQVNRLVGLNIIGLRRAGVGPAARAELKQLMKLVWHSGKNLSQALEAAAATAWTGPAAELLAFLQAPSRKGVVTFRLGEAPAD